MYTIEKFDTTPETDPYTGGESYTELWIKPNARQIAITQQYHDHMTPLTEWTNLEITLVIPKIDPAELKKFLTNNSDVDAIIDGHSTYWDGYNMCGMLSDEAAQAKEQLEEDLEWLGDVCPSMLSVVPVEDWLQDWDVPDDFVDMNYPELQLLADNLTDDARKEDAIIEDVYQYLINLQKDMINERED